MSNSEQSGLTVRQQLEALIASESEQEEAELVEKILAELSQEIYVIRDNGDIQYLPFQQYFNDENKLAWFNSIDDYHFCFVTPNGYQPLNLNGPIISKVIQWNVDHARLPADWSGPKLEPGYMIDLRGLHMSRLRITGLLNENEISAQRLTFDEQDHNNVWDSLAIDGGGGAVPPEFLDQLKQIPAENLYILSWQDPLQSHRLDRFGAYQLNYVSKEKLFESPMVDDLSTEGPILAEYLRNYYETAGVQTGRMNPLDFNHFDDLSIFKTQGFAITCYVANLKSFCR